MSRTRAAWRALHSAAAAVTAQGLTALGSVVVQVFAARQLGAAGYGTFTVVNGILLVVLAVQNGWVGDSLTVLDRWDPETRSALTVSQLGFLLLGFVACGLGALALEPGATALALDVGLMAVAYLSAELCRRVFMARQEFWALSFNNLVFVAATWVVLAVQTRGDEHGSLGGFALAVAAGSGVAVLVALVQLPLAELRPGRLSVEGLAELSQFAVWRSAQIGVRPLALLGMRLVVSVLAGRAAVGQLEAARLLMAPATTFTQGVGSFLLPMYAAEARGETGRRVRVTRVTAVVVGVTVVLSAVPLLFPSQAQSLLTQGSFTIPTLAIAGWAAFSVAFALGLPSANALVARRMSRQVLVARLVDGGVGLAGVLLLAVAGATHAVPFGLAGGALVGAALTLRLARPVGAHAAPRTPTVLVRSGSSRHARPSAFSMPTGLTGRPLIPGQRPGSLVRAPARALLAPAHRRFRLAIVPGVTLPLAALAMMVASDFKFRIRPIGQSLTATPDLNTLAEIGTYVVVFALLVTNLVRSRSTMSAASPLVFLTWLYAAYMCASVAWSVYPLLAVVRGWQFLVSAALMAAFARFASRRDLHRLAHGYVVLVAGSVVFGMLVHFPRQRLMVHRFNWLYVHPVIAGTWLGLAVVITLWLLLSRSERGGLPQLPLWAYWVVLVLVAGGLLGTQTRGAIGGCAAGVSVLLMVTFRRRLIELVSFGVVSLVVLGMLFLPTVLTYLARGESTSELTSFNGRTPLWDQAYHLVLSRPLVGYGTTASRGLFFDNVGLGGAHNAAINVLVDGGLLGFVLWIAVIGGIVRLLPPLLRTARGRVDVPVIAAALAYLFVNGGTTEGLGFVANVSSLWLFVLVGWVAVLCRRQQTAPPREPAPVHVRPLSLPKQRR